MIKKHIYCEIYRENIYFIANCSFEKLNNFVFKNFQTHLPDRNYSPSHEGSTYYAENDFRSFLIIYIPKFKIDSRGIRILSHELVHVTNLIFNAHKVKLDPENDEHQAYYMAWLVGRILS